MSNPDNASPPTKKRSTYRHGDLRRALLEAGIALAREGGPAAVVLREATRRAGVAPNAAYRHFASRQALFDAVRAHALGGVAHAIEREWAKALKLSEPRARARGLLRAVGTGYLRFAQAETGLFRTAFVFGEHDVAVPPDPARTAALGLNPFELLGAALDEMVQAGVLPAARRPQAEYLAWSAVHGMALLTIDGPLRTATAAARRALGERLVAMVVNGL